MKPASEWVQRYPRLPESVVEDIQRDVIDSLAEKAEQLISQTFKDDIEAEEIGDELREMKP